MRRITTYLILLLCLFGCGPNGAANSKGPAHADTGVVADDNAGSAAVRATASRSAPVIAVLIDFTQSISTYGVELPTVETLKPLVDLIDKYGGELAIGSIEENPRMPLLRLRLDPPEAPPTPPSTSSDVFTRNKLMRAYRKDREAHEAREEARRARNAEQITVYLNRIEGLLRQGATAGSTDVWGSLRRAETFLMEDPTSWASTPLRFALLVTDGRHNVTSSTYKPPDPSITVLVATGSKAIGDLTRLDPPPRWFESASGAIRFIVTNVEE